MTGYPLPLPVLLLTVLLTIVGCTRSGQEPLQHSQYAGQQMRQIKSLSADDIHQLEQGSGWGLAKAAELNGMPGPVHLLELRQQILLTDDQVAQIEAIFEHMRSQAILLGKRLIELEIELDSSFANGAVTEEQLRGYLVAIADVRSELRYVHLVAHLKTPTILTAHQIHTYNELRGYGAGDPCESVPNGHDPQRWKMHNNCD